MQTEALSARVRNHESVSAPRAVRGDDDSGMRAEVYIGNCVGGGGARFGGAGSVARRDRRPKNGGEVGAAVEMELPERSLGAALDAVAAAPEERRPLPVECPLARRPV